MKKLVKPVVTIGLLLLFGNSALLAQDDSWQFSWYWGAHGGATFVGGEQGVGGGAHWFITGHRSALQLGFDVLEYGTTNTAINNAQSLTGQTTVQFSSGRRLYAILYAVPNDNKLQIYGGGGFALNQINNAQPINTQSNAELNRALINVGDLDTQASLVFTGGFQLRFGRWALFGDYRLYSAGDGFLLSGDNHSVNGGLRYSLTGAHEEITTR